MCIRDSTNTGLSTTLVNTDGDAEPDYRDTDSDGDGTNDIAENGSFLNSLSGSDNDGDGLDDNFDDVDTSGTGIFDVNDNNDTPSTSLGDGDADVNTGGDMDYRDILNGIDTDGDGITDDVDIDDDNDGILDTVECTSSPTIPGAGASAVTASLNTTNDSEVLDGINGNGARFNSTGDIMVVDLGVVVAAGTIIDIESRATTTADKEIQIQQSDASGNFTSNPLAITVATYAANGTTAFNTEYTLATNARFLKITMNVRAGGRVNVDYIAYRSHTSTSCTDDFDGDGIANSLDIDADNDGILDVVEAQTTAGYIAPSGTVGTNGLYDVFETSADSGTPSFTPEMTVNDGNPDYLDIDTDDDGIPDNIEAQTTQGYDIPTGTFGLNGADAEYENNDTFTATGLSPLNFESTGDADFRDTDSDDDGILDIDESD